MTFPTTRRTEMHIDQPTAVPTRKVTAGTLAGALSVLLVWVLRLFSVEVPGEVGAAFATIIGFVTAYFVRDAPNV
jgi:putative flippase GtrA